MGRGVPLSLTRPTSHPPALLTRSSTSDGRYFCGPAGTNYPRNEREPPQSADGIMSGENPNSNRGGRIDGNGSQLGEDAGIGYGFGPAASEGCSNGEP